MRKAVASGLGLGLIPRRLWGADSGAGTFGAALAAGISAALLEAPWWIGLAVAVAAIPVAVWAAAPYAGEGSDPNWIVIDEVAGTLVALVGLSGWPWLIALLASRIADISKALPGISATERLPGAIGVTADDVLAGLYGLGAGWIAVAVGL